MQNQKEQACNQKIPQSPALQKTKAKASARKAMLTLFFDDEGSLLWALWKLVCQLIPSDTVKYRCCVQPLRISVQGI
jgi:hypothetical protein